MEQGGNRKKKESSLLWRLLRRYLANSSIHGVRYLVEDGRNWTERLFWLIVCGLSWWGCAVTIIGALNEFQNRRTSVTIDTNYINWPVELPAIHICVKETQDFMSYVKKTLGIKSLKKLINERDGGYAPELSEIHDSAVFQELADLRIPNCSLLFKSCEWDQQEIDCCEVFKPLMSYNGACLSINSIHTEQPNSKSKYYDHRPFKLKRVSGRDSFKIQFKNTTYFRKASTLMTIYVLSNTDVPSPIAEIQSRVKNTWKSLKDFKIDVNQIPIYNEEGVRGVPVEKRKCRFINEREYAGIYPFYSETACAVEQYLFRIYENCGCMSHVFPRAPWMQVCDQMGLECSNDTIKLFGDFEIDESCIADCEAPTYNIYLNWKKDKNVSTIGLNVNFLPGPKKRYVRYVVRSKLDVVVSVGSALGLFVGASLLSLVEIPYWFILRSIDDNDDDRDDESADDYDKDNGEKY